MKNLWPETFEPEALRPPKVILQEQGALLAKITNGMVQAEVAPMTGIDLLDKSMRNDFTFCFDFIGPFLDNYRFTLLRLSHDITIYPVKIFIDGPVSKELEFKLSGRGFGEAIAASPDEFETLLQRIFRCDRVQKTIGSLIALSK